jgi:hypothetical protein
MAVGFGSGLIYTCGLLEGQHVLSSAITFIAYLVTIILMRFAIEYYVSVRIKEENK